MYHKMFDFNCDGELDATERALERYVEPLGNLEYVYVGVEPELSINTPKHVTVIFTPP